VKTEAVKTEAVKTEAVKTEAVKTEAVNVIIPRFDRSIRYRSGGVGTLP
jgi:hypothetical protein